MLAQIDNSDVLETMTQSLNDLVCGEFQQMAVKYFITFVRIFFINPIQDPKLMSDLTFTSQNVTTKRQQSWQILVNLRQFCQMILL